MPAAGALDRLVLEYLQVQGHSKAAEELRRNLMDGGAGTGLGVGAGAVSSLEQYANGRGVSLSLSSSLPNPSQRLQENILFWGVGGGNVGVGKAFGRFLEWALQSLDAYRVELLRVAWPLFVESFLTITRARGDGQGFFEHWSPIFASTHRDELSELSRVTSKSVLDALVKESDFLKSMARKEAKTEVFLSAFALELLMRFLHAGRYFELMAVLNDRVSICVVAEVPRLEAAGSREKGREKVEAMASVSPVTLKHSTGPNVTPGTSADRIVLDLSGSGASTTRKVAGVSIKEAASLVSEAAKSKAVMDVAGHNARGLKPVHWGTFLLPRLPWTDTEMEEELARKRAEWEDKKRSDAAKAKAAEAKTGGDRNVNGAADSSSTVSQARAPQFQSQRRAINKRVTANAGHLQGPLPEQSVLFVSSLAHLVCGEASSSGGASPGLVNYERSMIRDRKVVVQRASSDAATGTRKRKREATRRKIDVDVLCHSVLGATTESTGYEWINAMDVSADGSILSAGCADSSVRVWRLDGNVLGTELGDRDALKRHANSAVGANEVSGFPSHRASADAATTSGLRLVGHAGSVFSTTCSVDLRWLVSGGGDAMVKLWDLRLADKIGGAASCVSTLEGHERSVWGVDAAPNSRFHYLATGSADRLAMLWDASRRYPLRAMVGHQSDVNAVRFHPNGTLLGTASSDKTVKVWDLRTAQDVRTLGCVSAAECVEFSHDGRLVAASDAAGDVSIFDLPSGRRIGTCSAGDGDAQITGLSFSHNVLGSKHGFGDIALAVSTTSSSRALQVFDVASFYAAEGGVSVGEGRVSLRTRSVPLLCAAFTHKNLLCTAGTLR